MVFSSDFWESGGSQNLAKNAVGCKRPDLWDI